MKLNKYLNIEKELGSGAFGQVYLCTYKKDNFSKLVAVKRINKKEGQAEVSKEALLNATLNHPNIVQIYDIFEDEEGNYLFVYEYIEGVTLRDYIRNNKNIKKETAIYIFINLLKGLDYLHKKNIIHHDLSPRNVMIGVHEEVKILDFGLSQVVDDDGIKNREENISGSLSYYDPYLIQNELVYDKEADLFSACLIFYELLSSSRLFNSINPIEILNELKQFKKMEDEDLENIEDSNLKRLLEKTLSAERKNRLSISEIKHILCNYDAKFSNYKDDELGTVTIVKRKIKKNRSSFFYFVILLIFVLIILSYFFLKNKKEDLFYVKINEEVYKAEFSILSNKIVNYHDVSQSFSLKACDYYYYSFLGSVALLDDEYSNQFKVNKENQKKYLKRFMYFSPFFLEKCKRERYFKVQAILSPKQFDKESLIKEVVNYYKNDTELMSSYQEATSWLKENMYMSEAIINYDIFRMDYQDQNITSCNELSQMVFVHKIIEPHYELEKIEKNLSILGIEKNKFIQIEGIYEQKLLLSSFSDQFKNMNFCLFFLKDKKVNSYYGRLNFERFKE